MNKRTNLLLIAVVVVVIIGVLAWRNSTKPPLESTTETTPAVIAERTVSEAASKPAEAEIEPVMEEEPAAINPEANESVDAESSPGSAEPSSANIIIFRGANFPVKSDVVLARVNDADITLKNLQPVSSVLPSEITVSAADFEKNLQLAIDREIILDTARRGNIQLDDEQRRLVEKSRLSAAAKGFSMPDNERPAYEAASNFESLDLMSNLLGDVLAKASGGPAKDVVSEEDYQKYMRGMLDDLRKQNSVKVFAVVEAP